MTISSATVTLGEKTENEAEEEVILAVALNTAVPKEETLRITTGEKAIKVGGEGDGLSEEEAEEGLEEVGYEIGKETEKVVTIAAGDILFATAAEETEITVLRT